MFRDRKLAFRHAGESAHESGITCWGWLPSDRQTSYQIIVAIVSRPLAGGNGSRVCEIGTWRADAMLEASGSPHRLAKGKQRSTPAWTWVRRAPGA